MRKEAADIRKLKKYKPTRFMAEGSAYNRDLADLAVSFIGCLKHTKGEWYGQNFELIDWQEQIIRDIFGVLKPNGYRQFNTAYIEIPKKQGKSELAAAVALLLTCGDGEERAEVYGCAADRQQASIVFNVAADMVRMCPALSKRVKILDSQKRLIYQPTGSIYQVLSADVGNKHGFNTHGVVFDELHTQPNRKLFDVMTKGSGDARMQPLYFLITTAGNDTKSICYEIHQKAKDIIEGRKIDHTFYPVIYGAEESDDWTDPKVWKKANPSLGITVGIDKVKAALDTDDKNIREERLLPITDAIHAKYDEEYADQPTLLGEVIYKAQKVIVRRWLLDEQKRVDTLLRLTRNTDDCRSVHFDFNHEKLVVEEKQNVDKFNIKCYF